MQQSDVELVDGWLAAERGLPADPHASKRWREGYDLKCKQFSYRKLHAQREVQQSVSR